MGFESPKSMSTEFNKGENYFFEKKGTLLSQMLKILVLLLTQIKTSRTGDITTKFTNPTRTFNQPTKDKNGVPESSSKNLSLDLSYKSFEEITTILKDASSNLEELNLHGCNLEKLPKILYSFKNLRKLNLARNKLCWIPDEMGYLENLTELNLKSNLIRNLPDSTSSFFGLKLVKLNLSSNGIELLNGNIGRLETLTDLDISNNRLCTLPDKLFDLENLKSLNVSSNKIHSLSPRIKNLNNLETLMLHGNSSPDFLLKLFFSEHESDDANNVKILSVNACPLGMLAGFFPKIEKLYLHLKKFDQIPEELQRTVKIFTTTGEKIQITEFPSCFEYFQHLKTVILQDPFGNIFSIKMPANPSNESLDASTENLNQSLDGKYSYTKYENLKQSVPESNQSSDESERDVYDWDSDEENYLFKV